ncbi:MAG TPA: hypothetical protein PKW69_07735, partial [Niabella sp.]|nr:hypothetical protein [Niabella sp.]
SAANPFQFILQSFLRICGQPFPIYFTVLSAHLRQSLLNLFFTHFYESAANPFQFILQSFLRICGNPF